MFAKVGLVRDSESNKMLFRDHPQIKGQGIWPPVWNNTSENGASSPVGEIGVLKFVHARPAVSSKCYIVMEHENQFYVGEFVFEDREFRQRIVLLLQLNIGRSVKEIGDIEFA